MSCLPVAPHLVKAEPNRIDPSTAVLSKGKDSILARRVKTQFGCPFLALPDAVCDFHDSFFHCVAQGVHGCRVHFGRRELA